MTRAEMFTRAGRTSWRRQAASAVRPRRRRRSAGPQRAAAALPGGARRRSAQRAVLRGRPRPAHLPAAVLVEVARRRHPRPLAHAARQLPHVAPDPGAGRPAAGAGRCPTSTATPRSAAARSRCSTARRRSSRRFSTQDEEIDAVAAWLAGACQGRRRTARDRRCSSGREAELPRARAAAEKSGLPFKVLDEHVETTSGHAVDQHHAPGQGPGVPGRRGHGLRRRDHPAAVAHRDRGRRQRSARRSTTPSGTCCTWRAPGRGITCW